MKLAFCHNMLLCVLQVCKIDNYIIYDYMYCIPAGTGAAAGLIKESLS